MERLSRRAALRRSIGLAALLAAGAAGCTPAASPAPTAAPKSDASKPAEGKSKPVAAPAARSGAAVTIEYWHINNETFGLPAIRDQIAKFKEKVPSIIFEERFHNDSYPGLLQNLQAALAARRPPAVAQIGHQYINYAPDNLPHTPVEELARDDREYLASFSDSVLALGRAKGTLHGMPFSLSNPVTYVNADLLRAAGLNPETPPASWEEIRAASRTVKERTGKFGVYLQTPPDNWITQGLIESNGGQVMNEDGTRATYDSPEAVEAMQLWADLAQQDKTLPLVTLEEGRQSFINGDVAMIVQTIANLANVRSKAQFSLLTAKFPTFGAKPRRVPGGGNSLYVFATDADQKAAAWEWIKFLSGPEGQTIWTQGTGYVPLPTGIADDPRYLKPFLDQNQLMRPALDQVVDVVQWSAFAGKNGPQAERVLVDARDEIIGGRRDARSALADATARANALLSQ